MRFSHLLALAGVMTLAFGVSLVMDEEPRATAEVVPAPKLSNTPPTSHALVLAADVAGAEEIASGEMELTQAAISRSTTTSSTTTTTASDSGQDSGGTPAATATTQPASPPATNAGGHNSSYESEFRSLINSLRASSGLPALTSSGSLNSRARSWAQTMAESGELAHSGFGAENVGRGGSVSSIFNALANSASHRANMLGDYTTFGVGVWVDSDGLIWTAHMFAP